MANENYTIPNTSYTIQKDQSVIIPTYAFQFDPEFFPNPEKYDPERLASENEQNTKIYMPFGDGQRVCIGERFAKMETKLALVVLLLNFEFEFSRNTKFPPMLNTKVILMSLKGGMYLKLKKISK